MTAYLQLVAEARTANAALGPGAAHDHVRATPAGRAAYREFLAAKGVVRGATTARARESVPAVDEHYLRAREPSSHEDVPAVLKCAVTSTGDAYLQAVAALRAADPSLSAKDAHKTTMRAHRELYAQHLMSKGIVR